MQEPVLVGGDHDMMDRTVAVRDGECRVITLLRQDESLKRQMRLLFLANQHMVRTTQTTRNYPTIHIHADIFNLENLLKCSG